jgi:acyl-CoA synthetase (AMP-forming)/AMP-acid ligase II
MSCRISDFPFRTAALFPDRPAAILGAQRLSYAGLAREVARCARALLAYGIGRGDRVAMLSTPRPEYLIVFLAAARIGAIWLGLNPVHRPAEQRQILEDCRPRLLFGIPWLRGEDQRQGLRALAAEIPSIERLVLFDGPEADMEPGTSYRRFIEGGDSLPEEAYAAALAGVGSDDVALIVYSSGSTSRPKGAMITHRNLVHCASVQHGLFPVEPLRVLCNLPVSHIASTSDIVSHALIGGGTIVFQERFDPAEALALISQERITCLLQIPTMLQRLLAVPDRRRFDTASLRLLFFLGAPMPADQIADLHELAATIVTGWGLTESSCSVTYTAPGEDIAVLAETAGRPAPGAEIRIAGPDGAPVGPGEAGAGETGEVLVRGPCVMAGYFGQPAASAAAIDAEGWLHSGDLGCFDAEGRLRLMGRIKEMFKSGGYNVYPREVEAALEAHPAVALAGVVGVPDPLYHETGCAFLLPKPGHALTAEGLIAHCRARLANYKIPKRFVIRDELPLLPIGKLDKTALKAEALRLSREMPDAIDAGHSRACGDKGPQV